MLPFRSPARSPPVRTYRTSLPSIPKVSVSSSNKVVQLGPVNNAWTFIQQDWIYILAAAIIIAVIIGIVILA